MLDAATYELWPRGNTQGCHGTRDALGPLLEPGTIDGRIEVEAGE